MADTKARGQQLLRTDDSTPGVVKFYVRSEADAAKAFIAQVDVLKIPGPDGLTLEDDEFPPSHPVVNLARHGATQNILDSSNKLEGQARVDYVREACRVVQSGGWASAPVDETKLRENVINGMMKLGLTRAAAEAAIAAGFKK